MLTSASAGHPASVQGLPWLAAGLALSAGLAAIVAASLVAHRLRGDRPRAHPAAPAAAHWPIWLSTLFGPRHDAAAGAGLRGPGERPPRGGEHALLGSGGGAFADMLELDVPELPEAFSDPITFAPMHDPVVLCGTGQVYDYGSLRAWLCTGQRKCPKTNLALVDVEVVRLPLLRHAVHEWMRQQGLDIPQAEATRGVLAAADPHFPGWVADLRCGDVSRRGTKAAAKINDVLIGWGADAEVGEELRRCREIAMEHVIDDLVWLLRHGDCYGQGVAAGALAQYPREEQRQWLAAVAAIPAVQLLASPNDYARHSAARLLSVVVPVHAHMARLLCDAGVLPGLMAQLDLARPFPYTRCLAASALCGIAAAGEEGGREAIRKAGAVKLLLGLVQQDESSGTQGCQHEDLVRFDKRDAASALLELQVTEEELALEGEGITLEQLRAFKRCSNAWLFGKADAPDEGYTEEELTKMEVQEAEEQVAAAAAVGQGGGEAQQGPGEGAGGPQQGAGEVAGEAQQEAGGGARGEEPGADEQAERGGRGDGGNGVRQAQDEPEGQLGAEEEAAVEREGREGEAAQQGPEAPAEEGEAAEDGGGRVQLAVEGDPEAAAEADAGGDEAAGMMQPAL